MVSREEIEHVAKLMKIQLDDHTVHIDRIQKMIGYFDILDKAGIDEEKLTVQETSFENLRSDEYIAYAEKLIEYLKNYKGKYVRAPKMS